MSKDPYSADHQLDYSRPFGWWGPHLDRPERRSLPWLVNSQFISLRSAAFLSLAVECRRSLIVAARPLKAGKTTTLTALIDFLPPATDRIYIRGVYERFAFLNEVASDQAYILCNEISAHLPAYLWGRGVRQLFEAINVGYPMATTMHASSGAEALDQLLGFPLEVPEEHAGQLDLIVTLGAGYVANRFIRRVISIDHVRLNQTGVTLESLSLRDPLRSEPQLHVGRMVRLLASWLNTSDERATQILASREQVIRAWIQQQLFDPDAVQKLIAEGR